jgi:hypothetical protein
MSVDDYIQNAPEARRPALTALRELLLATLDGYAETMRYNMPSYERGGEVEIAFASNKQHIAFYVLKEPVLDEYRDAFPKSRRPVADRADGSGLRRVRSAHLLAPLNRPCGSQGWPRRERETRGAIAAGIDRSTWEKPLQTRGEPVPNT